MADNNYTADTRPNDTPSDLPSLGQVPAYRAATEGISAIEKAYQSGLKITLSELGFWRQLVQFGGKARTSNPSFAAMSDTLKGFDRYTTEAKKIDRQDMQNDYVFRCGDYFLPINLTYKVKAEKNDSTSQLIDGAEIVQILNFKPLVVDVQLRIERDMSRIDTHPSASNMAFVDALSYEAYRDQNLEGTDPATMAISDLGVALRNLYHTQDVFKIENKVLNNDLGLDWVYMKNYEYSPNAGSTIVDINMTLREINMTENAIVFGNETVNSGNAAGGGS